MDIVQPEEEVTKDANFSIVEDFNPLADNTEDKSYVKYSVNPPENIPEPSYATSGATTPQPSPEQNAPKNSESSSSQSSSQSSQQTTQPKKEEKPQNTAPLSEDEVAKTADQILDAYEAYYPQLFLSDRMPWCPKFKKQVVDNLIAKKLIDPNKSINTQALNPETNQPMMVTLPLGNYFMQHNSQMDMVFAVKPEEKAALRDPLIEVLKEQDFQLTPIQRLGIAFGLQTGTRLILCMGINHQRGEDMKKFMQAHKEQMEANEAILRNQREAEARRQEAENNKQGETGEVVEEKIKKSTMKKPTIKEVIAKKKK